MINIIISSGSQGRTVDHCAQTESWAKRLQFDQVEAGEHDDGADAEGGCYLEADADERGDDADTEVGATCKETPPSMSSLSTLSSLSSSSSSSS